MLRRIIGLIDRSSKESVSAARVPDGARIYAIGDVHGRLDLLDDLLARIDSDHAAREASPRTLIFLGDLVDRGPHSAQVIDRLIELERRGEDVRFIQGNHEEVMLKALAGHKKALPFFLRIGGAETVMSYGVDADTYRAADYDEVLAIMRERVPQAHIDFLAGFEDIIVLGDYAFVHAGVKPQVPLEDQTGEAFRWIRQGFVDWNGRFEKVIVHGHTISDAVEDTGTRIGLDTGAYETGRLTAMGFEGDRRWILQTGTD